MCLSLSGFVVWQFQHRFGAMVPVPILTVAW
jgi:hypothetical protein